MYVWWCVCVVVCRSLCVYVSGGGARGERTVTVSDKISGVCCWVMCTYGTVVVPNFILVKLRHSICPPLPTLVYLTTAVRHTCTHPMEGSTYSVLYSSCRCQHLPATYPGWLGRESQSTFVANGSQHLAVHSCYSSSKILKCMCRTGGASLV